MSEASMRRVEAATDNEQDAARQPPRLMRNAACLAAGALALAVPLLWLAGPERSFGDTLAVAAWAWLLLGVPLLVVLVTGAIRSARQGREPKLLGVAQWFAIGLALGVVLLETPRLLLS